MSHKKEFSGFSLVELMLAVMITTLVLLMFIGIFMSMLQSAQKGIDVTSGIIVAKSVMNRFLYDAQEKPGGLDINLYDTGNDAYKGEVWFNKTEYKYEISCKDTGADELIKVNVRVWWWQGEVKEEHRIGYGNLSTGISRVIFKGSKMEVIQPE